MRGTLQSACHVSSDLALASLDREIAKNTSNRCEGESNGASVFEARSPRR